MLKLDPRSLVVVALIAMSWSCHGSDKTDPTCVDGDADTDADTDSDTDADADSDSDADTDTDTDVHSGTIPAHDCNVYPSGYLTEQDVVSALVLPDTETNISKPMMEDFFASTIGLTLHNADRASFFWGNMTTTQGGFHFYRDNDARDRMLDSWTARGGRPAVFDAGEYLCFLSVVFDTSRIDELAGAPDPCDPGACTGTWPSDPTCPSADWMDLQAHLFSCENYIDNTRMASSQTVFQQTSTVTLHNEAESNRPLMEHLWRVASGSQDPTWIFDDQHVTDLDFQEVYGCGPENMKPYDGLRRYVTDVLGLGDSMAVTIAGQLAGPEGPGFVETDNECGSPNLVMVDDRRINYGMRATVNGRLRCRCGDCSYAGLTGDAALYYEADRDVQANVDQALIAIFGGPDPDRWTAEMPPQSSCDGLEMLVKAMVRVRPLPDGTRSKRFGGVLYPLVEQDVQNDHERVTVAEFQEFLIAFGNSLPNLIDAPFADLVPRTETNLMVASDKFTSDLEMDYMEKVFEDTMRRCH
ncbi:MAG: hypothetical protein KC621_09730 [Myxococcales bacterium]|nr:hypothetical protein [Myxococcales bacterium]